MDNRLKTLGLCARARKIVTGEDLVLESIRKGKAKLVFLAHDAGPNTSKSIRDKASFYNVCIDDSYSTMEISNAVGTNNRVVVAVLDDGFAKNLKR